MSRRKFFASPRRLLADRDGVAAIEFAILALPLFIMIFGIIEVSLMFFVNSSLDASVHKISRMIRTGEVASSNMTLADFKAKICSDMLLSFNCSSDLLVKVNVLSDISSAASADPIDDSGNLTVTESFDVGKGSDYILVQTFLPWTAVVNFFSLSSAKLSDGRYLLGSAVLFRNEPF
ncbi:MULTISPECIES: TadE/TadG family type IV pilus assembly protein [Rhizobium]|jgi:Flp pilus assembly protein TadG|uniref:Pilus assembly protein n=1 Tax=Rhizobium anhuiense TaxID=1184720 RepID=A0A3S0XJH0_9HYPH|nr:MULTISPECIES: TadE/TadG family type IV pilus assembly protein [Rhizobium]KZS55063.1 pilus assembly protein TadG [Rhizobium anhuiense bv. trifolii]MBB3301631.1 Flp pilus assembly protein TadG [Rhizobium sp. BK112]MBB3370899.1 Flp pilus assembly protein TadG [Rhizobium sp. BK077]MBB3746860.1 Flp pilus assembly protein TadG [Rhizobium sp. BK591]MBB4115413.1 Flp pilus assembly protein TadG [Rhizobium sp. BK226]